MIRSILSAATVLAFAGLSAADCTANGVGLPSFTQGDVCYQFCTTADDTHFHKNAQILCKEPFEPMGPQSCTGPCVTCPAGPFYSTIGPKDSKKMEDDPKNCGTCGKECTGATPMCDNGNCVATCTLDPTCASIDSTKPKCGTVAPNIGACVQCLAAADCKSPSASICDLAPTSPTFNKCIQCQSNSQCTGTAAFCNTATGFCSSLCSNDNQCGPSAPACVAGNCVACSKDSHCSGNPVGSFCVNNMCQAKCSTNAQCAAATPSKPFCTAGSCFACVADADCPTASPFCNTGVCAATCSADAQCRAKSLSTPFCSNGQCTPSCSTSSQCLANLPSQPICKAGGCDPCTSHADCSGAFPLTPFCNVTSGECSAVCTGSGCPTSTTTAAPTTSTKAATTTKKTTTRRRPTATPRRPVTRRP